MRRAPPLEAVFATAAFSKRPLTPREAWRVWDQLQDEADRWWRQHEDMILAAIEDEQAGDPLDDRCSSDAPPPL